MLDMLGSARTAFVLPLALALGQPAGAGWATPAVENTSWVVVSRPHIDLWYHGLAVVEFGREAGITLYHTGYLERVRTAKQALGVYPTALDRAAEEIKRDFDSDRVFQVLHFLPLYFPNATAEQMLQGLAALCAGTLDSGNVAIETAVGLQYAASEFTGPQQRLVLGRFVRALQEEWRQFFRSFWSDSLAMSQEVQREVQSGWDEYAEEPLGEFLSRHNLDSGRIFLSAVLGPEGRAVEEDRGWGRENAVAVWMPLREDPIVSVSAAVREMCMRIIDGRVLDVSGSNGQQPMQIVSSAAVRCGALLLERGHSDLLPLYQQAFLGAVHGTASDAELATAFENAYPVDSAVIELLRVRLDAAVDGGETGLGSGHWSVRLKPQIDLWYHGLAIVGVDREDLLSRYDRDYAGKIARAKQNRGIGATRLDSMAGYFRSQFGSKSEFRLLDQLPLFFGDATPEQMLTALAAVADRQAYRRDKVSPEASTGAAVAAQAFDRSSLRRVLSRYVEAMEQEWQVFYRDYWIETVAADATRRSELNRFWATTVEPRLDGFLAGRGLDGGTIVVSSAVGPEGRLYVGDLRSGEDNQVVVWSPPESGPRDPAYRVVKEICYSVVAPAVEDFIEPKVETISLRMAAAVRCGAMVLDRYAPILSAGYRRAMMMGVGADTATATVSRFEERFALDEEILAAMRNEIDRP